MERKKQFVSLRKEVKDNQADIDDDSYMYSASVNLASQYLADSSLREDVSVYDYSATNASQVMSVCMTTLLPMLHR